MADIKLFRFSDDETRELAPKAAQLERGLQRLIEKRMECFLGIRFLAREYRTGRKHRGSIDSLGIDENNCPVIIEYKRFNDDNVICQGLYYLDWLMDHQARFLLLTREKLGKDAPESVEFGSSRILCIAQNFSRYDERAIMQIDRNIELIRYRFFEDDLLMLEMLNTSISMFLNDPGRLLQDAGPAEIGMPAPLQERVRGMSAEAESLYFELLSFAENLGDDVSVKFTKHYIALARLKNFTTIQPLKNSLKLWLNLDPAEIPLEEGFSRDVGAIGHVGTGNLEVEVRDREALSRAQALIELAYQRN